MGGQNMRNDFDTYFKIYQKLPADIQQKARSLAIDYMNQDEDCEEIGTSDVSCVVFGWLAHCQTPGEMIVALVDKASEIT